MWVTARLHAVYVRVAGAAVYMSEHVQDTFVITRPSCEIFTAQCCNVSYDQNVKSDHSHGRGWVNTDSYSVTCLFIFKAKGQWDGARWLTVHTSLTNRGSWQVWCHRCQRWREVIEGASSWVTHLNVFVFVFSIWCVGSCWATLSSRVVFTELHKPSMTFDILTTYR